MQKLNDQLPTVRTMISWCAICKRFAFREDLVCDDCVGNVAQIKTPYQKKVFRLVLRTIDIPQPKSFEPCIIVRVGR